MNKLFFTSVLVMCLVAPAVAENFPSNGYMLEGRTYTKAATYQNMGKENDGDEVFAVANYAQCPLDFPISDPNASSEIDCYRECSSSDVPNVATFTSSSRYYTVANACVAKSCNSGYDMFYNVSGFEEDWNSLSMVDNNCSVTYSAGSSGGYALGAIPGTTTLNKRGYGCSLEQKTADQGKWEVSDGQSDGFRYSGLSICVASDEEVLPYYVTQDGGPGSLEDGPNCYCKLTEYKTGFDVIPLSGAWVKNVGPDAVVADNYLGCVEQCAEVCAGLFSERLSGATQFKSLLKKYTGVASNTQCQAHTYTLSYSCGTDATGSIPNQSVVFNTKYTARNNGGQNPCVKPGYEFAGWKDSQNNTRTAGTEYTYTDTTNMTFTAQWTQSSYSITYVVNGGSNYSGAPSNYTVSDTVVLGTPTKRGYTFVDWYENSSFTGNPVKEISGSTGNKTLYAKWTPNKIIIKWLGANADDILSSTEVSYDGDIVTPKNARHVEGKVFLGWVFEKNNNQ